MFLYPLKEELRKHIILLDSTSKNLFLFHKFLLDYFSSIFFKSFIINIKTRKYISFKKQG